MKSETVFLKASILQRIKGQGSNYFPEHKGL
jgi:hypothetical protein